MPTSLNSEWEDCRGRFIVRDFEGKLRFMPTHLQRRTVMKAGGRRYEYRVREETEEEILDRQW